MLWSYLQRKMDKEISIPIYAFFIFLNVTYFIWKWRLYTEKALGGAYGTLMGSYVAEYPVEAALMITIYAIPIFLIFSYRMYGPVKLLFAVTSLVFPIIVLIFAAFDLQELTISTIFFLCLLMFSKFIIYLTKRFDKSERIIVLKNYYSVILVLIIGLYIIN